jgi:hypothetical protein
MLHENPMHKDWNNHKKRRSTLITSLITTLIMVGVLAGIDLVHLVPTPAAASASRIGSTSDASTLRNIYLPILHKKNNVINAFGVESHSSFYPGNIITNYTTQMNANYVRMNGRISWRALQEYEGTPIKWELLVGFETELRTLRAANITPIIIVDDYPYWATDNTVRLDGKPTSCGPLRQDRYDDFANFMQALVSRYSTSTYNAHIWEMGNEPDVDPNLLVVDSPYGCWGDWDDIYYNGRAYGEMLKVVIPAVKAIDPAAQVWVGGLLLASPNTIDDHVGQPEDFFHGILEAGAGPYLDAVAYHAYTHYHSVRHDEDLYYEPNWDAWGGIIRGKARFLRSFMSEYSVDIPLYITETSLLCNWCTGDNLPPFYNMQANLAPRSFPRAMAENISGFIWYTLEGPGWLNSGLLDENQVPKPAYYSYQTLAEMVANATLSGPASYGDGIEAYTFYKGAARIDIIFAIEDVSYTIYIPRVYFIAAYDRFGNLITPTTSGTNILLNIRFEPIYLVRTR